MWDEAGTPYLDMFIRDSIPRRNRRSRNNTDVVHHETCPCCGRKLVNLYRGETQKVVVYHGENVVKTSEEWKCKACWDKEKGDKSE